VAALSKSAGEVGGSAGSGGTVAHPASADKTTRAVLDDHR
jgi:hypothetical protein